MSRAVLSLGVFKKELFLLEKLPLRRSDTICCFRLHLLYLLCCTAKAFKTNNEWPQRAYPLSDTMYFEKASITIKTIFAIVPVLRHWP